MLPFNTSYRLKSRERALLKDIACEVSFPSLITISRSIRDISRYFCRRGSDGAKSANGSLFEAYARATTAIPRAQFAISRAHRRHRRHAMAIVEPVLTPVRGTRLDRVAIAESLRRPPSYTPRKTWIRAILNRYATFSYFCATPDERRTSCNARTDGSVRSSSSGRRRTLAYLA